MKKPLLIIAAIIFALVLFKKESTENVIIPDNSIRFRVISNSNSRIDIKEKMKIKEILNNYLFEKIKNAKTNEEANKIVEQNLPALNKIVFDYLKSNNFSISYGLNYFPAKTYKGVIYNAGYYQSLVVTLGTGNGENWWCVLFPPLCLIEGNPNTSDVQYKLYISNIINDMK